MGKLAEMPSQAVISGFKGVVDFYDYCGIPCFRKWPVYTSKKRSPAVEAQYSAFGYSAALWKSLSREIQETYNTMATGTGLTGRDMFTRAYIKGLFTYSPPKEEEMKIIWKDASEEPVSDLNRTVGLDWTTLDLTAYTSANAKFALLQLFVSLDSVSSSSGAMIRIRKNGTTPDHQPDVQAKYDNGDRSASTSFTHVIVGLDSERKVEYKLHKWGTIQFDSHIVVLGYVE